jgi:hypothetical protein
MSISKLSLSEFYPTSTDLTKESEPLKAVGNFFTTA